MDMVAENIIVKGDTELLRKLEDGYSLVQSLDDDKFLMKLNLPVSILIFFYYQVNHYA
jgi:hypothetical protein